MHLWTFLVAIMLVFAGCTSKDPDPAPRDDDPGPGATVGTIGGAVVTPTINPIQDATVVLEPGGQSDDTGLFGSFKFEAVPPGTYILKATADGFLPAEQSVVVEAGKKTSVRVVMQYDIPPQPRHDTFPFQGYFSASLGAADEAGQPIKDLAGTGNCTCVFNLETPRYLSGLTIEAVWDDGMEAGEGTAFRWNVSLDDEIMGGGSGTSPMHGVLPLPDVNTTGSEALVVTILPDDTMATYDQAFDLYVTVWQVDAPDPAYSFVQENSG